MFVVFLGRFAAALFVFAFVEFRLLVLGGLFRFVSRFRRFVVVFFCCVVAFGGVSILVLGSRRLR